MLTSRKWKAVLIDAIFLTITTLLTLYLKVSHDELIAILGIVGSWQAVVIAYILGTAYEDGQEKRAVTYTDGSVPTMPYPDNITSNLEGPG